MLCVRYSYLTNLKNIKEFAKEVTTHKFFVPIKNKFKMGSGVCVLTKEISIKFWVLGSEHTVL
jgi:hypothetical protein